MVFVYLVAGVSLLSQQRPTFGVERASQLYIVDPMILEYQHHFSKGHD